MLFWQNVIGRFCLPKVQRIAVLYVKSTKNNGFKVVLPMICVVF